MVRANPKSAFGSSQLTAPRKFELDAETVAAANQIVEVVQEMLLGAPVSRRRLRPRPP